jgi:hypothetical protein
MTRPEDTPTPPPAVIDGVDVAAVAAVVQGCAGVSALVGGRFGEVVSYLPGRKVAGVLVRDGRVRIQVRSRWGIPAADLGALIKVLVAPLTGYRPVDVLIADIDEPTEPTNPTNPVGAQAPATLSGCES